MQELGTAGMGIKGQSLRDAIASYVQLAKPRIIVLLLISTAGAMWIASGGQVGLRLSLVTLIGGTLAAASANTINCLYDRDIDREMERTRFRPLPAGRVSPRDALIYAMVLAIAAFGLLATGANLLAAWLAMAGIATYVFVYTFWLKRSTAQNIVIGGAAGAIPPLVGWAAVTGELSWAAWVLFAIIFVWTPPHFWALALAIRDEYAKVGVPMLPVVAGPRVTVRHIIAYAVLMVPVTLLLVYPLGVMGAIYGLAALGLGIWFVRQTLSLAGAPEDRAIARRVFKSSILYLMLLCGAMAADSLPATHLLTERAWQIWQASWTQLAAVLPL